MPEFLEIINDWNGFSSIHEARRPENYEQRLKETIDLLTNAKGLPRHRREYLLREAMTTSDFPLLFGDVLDRSVLASYKAVEPAWRPFAKKKNNKDFRPASMFAITGGDEHLDPVNEKNEYPESVRNEARYQMTVVKKGRKFNISWESLINDDIGALNDTAERFAKAALRTEARDITSLYAQNLGLHANGFLYENGVNAGALPLTINNLEASCAAMASFVDGNNEPILNRPKYLVVPPVLEFVARAILTSASKIQIDPAGGIPYPMTNVIPQSGLQLIVDPYLPVVNPANPNSWYLFADPSEIAALGYGYLTGHETPEVCMKASDKVSLSGAPMSPFTGDFDSDNIQYRVRIVFGGCRLDWRATYANFVA